MWFFRNWSSLLLYRSTVPFTHHQFVMFICQTKLLIFWWILIDLQAIFKTRQNISVRIEILLTISDNLKTTWQLLNQLLSWIIMALIIIINVFLLFFDDSCLYLYLLSFFLLIFQLDLYQLSLLLSLHKFDHFLLFLHL